MQYSHARFMTTCMPGHKRVLLCIRNSKQKSFISQIHNVLGQLSELLKCCKRLLYARECRAAGFPTFFGIFVAFLWALCSQAWTQVGFHTENLYETSCDT